MEVVIRKLREQRGEISLNLGLILLFAVFLFLVVFNIRHAYQVVDRVIDKTNEAVLAQAAVNGPTAAGGIREGAAVARNYNGTAWRRIVTSDGVLASLQQSMGGSVNGRSLVREGFRIDNLTTTFVNADGGNLHFITSLDLTIYLLGGDVLPVTRHLEVESTYEAKF